MKNANGWTGNRYCEVNLLRYYERKRSIVKVTNLLLYSSLRISRGHGQVIQIDWWYFVFYKNRHSKFNNKNMIVSWAELLNRRMILLYLCGAMDEVKFLSGITPCVRERKFATNVYLVSFAARPRVACTFGSASIRRWSSSFGNESRRSSPRSDCHSARFLDSPRALWWQHCLEAERKRGSELISVMKIGRERGLGRILSPNTDTFHDSPLLPRRVTWWRKMYELATLPSPNWKRTWW